MQRLLSGEVTTDFKFKKDPQPRGAPFGEIKVVGYSGRRFEYFFYEIGDKVRLKDDKEAGVFRVLDRWISGTKFMYLIMPITDNFNGRLRTEEINLMTA